MWDDEIVHVLAGWAAVFIGASLALLAAVSGLVFIGILWTLLASAGILVLIYAFLRWRLPEIIKFFKEREWEIWIRSQGL